ncbi:hypothetical protein CEUSTIGMA_g9352.t1 [Chlamydomonas eustigma]|uniref:tRNA 4-demethylwyosine synthase (AdoMet-dependent) n=1 Tax=Chlamydomonas eustigma TaxID=1157962 RepID=A0A250XFR8_9CHLO|nr:hypothetical protein CEUSTIGMA_g9352.t1 [Chlamydomonas eustigma]|eukprot:GAX81924.1 hypothetical protein CEUSTIGMA_g9352.t1 [Chlamydomonas eustigma]
MPWPFSWFKSSKTDKGSIVNVVEETQPKSESINEGTISNIAKTAVTSDNCERGEGAFTSCSKDAQDCSSSTTACACSSFKTSPSPNLKALNQQSTPQLLILYGSQTGMSKAFAEQLAVACKLALASQAEFEDIQCMDMTKFEPERLISDLPEGSVFLIVVSTYEGGTPPDAARWFCRWLEDAAHDFRVGSSALLERKIRYAVFGCGNSLYGDNFNAVAKRVDSQLSTLGGVSVTDVGLGDEDTGKLTLQFQEWSNKVIAGLSQDQNSKQSGGSSQNKEVQTQQEGTTSDNYEDTDDDEEEDLGGEDVDMEDLGGVAPKKAKKSSTRLRDAADADSKHGGERSIVVSAPEMLTPIVSAPEMLTPIVRASLTKQGYKLIGTHSGVKMCRWTKSMLRGRGGCYKHAFYGIESHRCMEATPSLACANKCVFCWRHHSNPVGRSWKWAMDGPVDIVDQAVSLHQRMVKEYSGVPGVVAERVAEGLQIRHCALSLVGEPIMYPEINGLVSELHKRHISTFLVTNAQFPDRIKQLSPVTQLYVSVDAATPESLKAIDRPLFSDYWERFTACLSCLKEKQQRTVYRLTLVKGWNMAEVQQYASLIDLGQPDFIEIKGVTYCGDSGASSLTMQNVPYHVDVREFGQAICNARNGEYGLACEHAHSCCILLARTDRFLIDGRWHTWIDYEKFQQLVRSGKSFTTQDYLAETPAWAEYGSNEAGFDPIQQRVKKERKHPGKSSNNNIAETEI